ncbi:response regulator transcription factor [Phocaeicola sp.]
MIKLLLVEDDANLSYIIRGGLEDMIGGYEVTTASDGEEGLRIWREQRPDVIVSDIEMPVMDGYEMVKRIRETDGDTPIVFTSGRVSPKDVVKGYELGVNNYIKKPFLADELDAHIGALLKMKQGKGARNESEVYRIGDDYFFDAPHAVLKQASGASKTLTEREAKLLQMLCEKKNEVVKREAILAKLWDTKDDYFASRSLDVFVARLRKLLAEDEKVQIKTVKGVGLSLADSGS